MSFADRNPGNNEVPRMFDNDLHVESAEVVVRRASEDSPAGGPVGADTAHEVNLDGRNPPSSRSVSEFVQETLLPVHGLVRFSFREFDVINHPAFQRLFSIFQLGQTHLVYRGATHMRGEHCLGSVHTAMAMVEAVRRNSGKSTESELRNRWTLGAELSDVEIAFIRLGALLHDVGHLPAGHTLEDELGLLDQHDGLERLNLVLDRRIWHGQEYPSLRSIIDDKYEGDARAARQLDAATNEVLSASRIVTRLIGKDYKHPGTIPNAFRIGVCRDIIGNTICADILDYLHRDWLHLGKPRHFDYRLLDYLEIRTKLEPESFEKTDKLVINLKGGSRPRPDAVTAILDLLESRYQLTEIALYHRVKLSAASMLERVASEYNDTFATDEERVAVASALVSDMLECSDMELLNLLEQRVGERAAKLDGEAKARLLGSQSLLHKLRVRNLHRDFGTFYAKDVGGAESVKRLAQMYTGLPADQPAVERKNKQVAAFHRLMALRSIEADFELPPGSITMYCPPTKMNMKIAEVGVYLNEWIDPLAQMDAEGSHEISGGHLQAQQERFKRLWRISFFMERGCYALAKQRGEVPHILRTIQLAILLPLPGSEEPGEELRRIAKALTQLPESNWFGKKVAESLVGARQNEQGSYPGSYPSGEPWLRAYIE